MNLGFHLRIAASGIALVMAGSVQAQDRPDPDNAGAAAIDDIVVTAQKREQSLQEVPISVAAFTAESIEALGAESMGDLDTFTPGLSVDDASVTQPKYTIRGVSTDDFGVGTEPAVGVFIDGVYAARSGNALIFFDDLERVEVLKGPQGTLFGRNTSAGAVSVITRKPSERFEAAGRVTLGNDEKRRVSGMINMPLGDMFALRVNGVYNRRDGYLTDAVTGEGYERENNWSGRAAIAFRPDAATEIIASYDHDTTDKDGPAAIGVGPFALTRDPFGPFANDVLGGSHETRKLDAFTLGAVHDLGGVSLTSLTSFRKFRTTNREDEDGTNLSERYLDTENVERNRNFYQELRLSQTGDRLNWVLGGSYFKERARQSSVVTLLTDSADTALGLVAGFPVFSILDTVAGLPVFGLPWQESMNNLARNRSFALFGDATYAVTSALNLTVGARYTWDRKRFSWFNEGYSAPGLDAVAAPGALYNAILGLPAFPDDATIDVNSFYRAAGGTDLIFDVGALEGVPFERTERFEDFSPRFVVDYKLTPDVMAFASVARGYKAGGFNSVQINSFFRPEKVWNYEAGLKSDLFGRRLRLNASAYYFNYTDRQSISLENVSGSGIPQYVTVSGDSEAWGVDFEGQFAATSDLRLSVVGGYIDSKWNKRIERGVDIAGQPTGEPSLRVVLGANYDRELANGSAIFADASYSYTSRTRMNDAARASDAALDAHPVYGDLIDFSKFRRLRSSREIVNARIGWRAPDDRVSIALFAENLFDVQVPRGINSISVDTFGTPYTRLDRPRSWGVELSGKF